MANQSPDQDIAIVKPSRHLLAYVLSFIGFGRSPWQMDNSGRSPSTASITPLTSSKSRTASVSSSLSTSTSTSSTSSSTSFYTPPLSGHYHDKDTLTDFYQTCSDTNKNIMDSSTVFVPNTSSQKQTLYDSWKFQHWVRQLPKLGLLHLVSHTAMQDPTLAYELLEAQYTNDCHQNIGHDQDKDIKILCEELKWIEAHTRAIVHQLDTLRPNERFAKVKEITRQLESLIGLAVNHFHGYWGDSLITLFALILLAQECLDSSSEIRQYLFYRAKMGRTLILEMTSVLKNHKVYQVKKLDHADNNDRNNTTQRTPSPQQATLARLFFNQRGSTLTGPVGWFSALKNMCDTLARLDEHWEHRDEYNLVVTLLE